jgi:hypothetical protein
MSLLKTKPPYAPNAVATDRGWTNPVTGEVLIAIGMLKTKLETEQVKIVGATANVVIVDEVATVVEVEKINEPEKEIVMEPVVKEIKPAKVRKEYTKKQIIGEVMEHIVE